MVAKTYHRYLIIAEQKLRTQRILGNLLKKSKVSKNSSNQHMVGHKEVPSSLSSFSITKNESSAFQKIASLPQEIFEEEIATAKEETNK